MPVPGWKSKSGLALSGGNALWWVLLSVLFLASTLPLFALPHWIWRAERQAGSQLVLQHTFNTAPGFKSAHLRVVADFTTARLSINGKPAGPKVNPLSHPRKVKGFLRSENQAPNPVFLKNWGEVCGEWSKRYGKLVSGWWFDGYKMEMKEAYEGLKKEKHNIDTWIAAVRSGNPDAELAFNAGAHPILSLCTNGKLCPHQTYTSGENHDFHQKTKKGKGKLLTPKNFPAPEGVVWHLLLPIGKGWGAGEESRFDLATLRDRVDHINAEGGAVTFDVPITGDGVIPAAVLRVLKDLGKDIDKFTDGARSF